jgi:hypothetical protein
MNSYIFEVQNKSRKHIAQAARAKPKHTSCPNSANLKFVSQGRNAVSLANLRRNSTLRNNNSQSWCYWPYWFVLMTVAAVSGDAAHLAQCSMVRASPHAIGHWCRVSVCNVSPRWLPWSSLLPVERWPTKHNFLPTYYIENQLFFFNGMKKSDMDDIDKECSIFSVKTIWC